MVCNQGVEMCIRDRDNRLKTYNGTSYYYDDLDNLLLFGNYTGWGRLNEEIKVTDSAY